MIERKYGWKKGKDDNRDIAFRRVCRATEELPTSVDLRSLFKFDCYDQGQLGSCTANGIAAAVEYDLEKQNLQDFMPSRLFIYYNERSIENTIYQDSGAAIRDGIKTINKFGVCPEAMWPYDVSKFATQPTQESYNEALNTVALQYEYIDNRNIVALKSALAKGFPIIFGMEIYASFESQGVAQTGMVPMPQPNEQSLGGHCMLIVGYRDEDQKFIVRNSWGRGWADNGHCYIPYQYITDPYKASDFWIVESVK